MAKSGVFYRLRRNLAELIDPRDEERRDQPAAPRGTIAPLASTFEDKLRSLLGQTGQPSLLSGRINFIGLQKIRERFGTAWPRIADRADRIARNTIERHLAPDDIYTAVNGISYVVVFARLSQEQAQLKCVLIGDEIAKLLLGEEGANLLEVRTAVTRVDGSFDLKSLPSADALAASLLDERAQAAPASTRATPPPGPTAAPTALRDVLSGLEFGYRPIWDQARNVISTYMCVALVPTSDVGDAKGDAELVVAGDEEGLARLDTAVRQRVLHDLDECIRDNRRLLLTLPVHFETLGPLARRREYLAALQRLDAEARKLLVIELAGVPEGVPQSRLIELLTPLKQLCRGVMLRVALELPDLAHVKGTGASAVGCDVSNRSDSEFMLMQQMNRFNRAATKTNVATYVHGAHSLSLVAAAIGAGFGYVDGDAVARLIDAPRRIADFSLSDLYRPFLKAEQAQIFAAPRALR